MLITLINLNKCVIILDVIFAWIVVAPLVVMFYYSSWQLYDLYIFPEQAMISCTFSLVFGFCGQMALMFYQDSIEKHLKFENGNLLHSFFIKMCALFLGHTFVSFWRGIWSYVDATSADNLGVVALNLVQNSSILMILRAFRNSLAPPYIVLTDHRDGNGYRMTTLLKKSKADGSFTFFVDCICTMIVELLVAFVWHDMFLILDTTLIPDNLFYSALLSLLIGYLLALICFTLQSSVGFLCNNNEDNKVFIYDTFMAVCLISAINIWRGVWSFLIIYAGKDIKWLFILNITASTLLMIMNCTCSISPKDVLKDADESGQNCVKFPIQYFQTVLQPHQESEKQNSNNIFIQT